jgi:thymidylate synthase (FAD)
MKATRPEVFLVARPALDWDEVARYLVSVGGTSWFERMSNGPDSGRPDGERLVELMGRLCYRSWAPGLNPNISRVREDSDAYLTNILRSAHGSVLEHANYSFILANVSRVFTHELVRHRAGTAISQESLRYVRLTELPFEHPEAISSDPRLLAAATHLLEQMEKFQELVSTATQLDDADVNFHTKKTITSAARRYAPDGVATTIGWTVNIRALRHVIAARTDPGAEAEIRRVFDRVAQLMKRELPALLADFSRADDGTWLPEYPKV